MRNILEGLIGALGRAGNETWWFLVGRGRTWVRGGGEFSGGWKVAPLQVLLQFCGSGQRARNDGQLNLNIQLCDV